MRGSAASVLDAVEALLKFLLVAGAQSEDAAAAVKLVSDILVHLAELVKLAGNVIILQLHNLSVLLQSVLLSEAINILAA